MKRVTSWVSYFVFGLFLAVLPGCGGGGDEGFSGSTASLSWDPVAYHHSPITYTVHFGKHSSGEDGSCNYENSVDAVEPFAVITALEFNTRYYFSVSARTEHGRHSQCSNEVSKLTEEAPPVQIGDPPVKVASASLQYDAKL